MNATTQMGYSGIEERQIHTDDNGLGQMDIKSWVSQDLKDFQLIDDSSVVDKSIASDLIAANSANHPQYKAMLDEQAPELTSYFDDVHARNKELVELKEIKKDHDAQFMENNSSGEELDDYIQTTIQRRKQHEARLNMVGLQEIATQDKQEKKLGQAENEIDVIPTGAELPRQEMIIPRKIVNSYSEVDGRFYAKDSNRLMFEDKGNKIASSVDDKSTIADMVLFAKSKQWDSLKLSGSMEFRRQAWLEAESQGIKTQGYTPKEADLAALKTLTQERQTNLITPVRDRQMNSVENQPAAPRHDLNKNQATMHDAATKNITTNLLALQSKKEFQSLSQEQLNKLAYWRGIVQEDNKMQPKQAQDAALTRFDRLASDPKFITQFEKVTETQIIEEKTVTEKVQTRDTHEQSL